MDIMLEKKDISCARGRMEAYKKIVSISSKRQITIPMKFYTELGFEGEAECIVRGSELVLRPVKNETGSGEFAEQILAELISKGLSGQELLTAFKEQQAKIRPAVNLLLQEAQMVAEDNAEYATYCDVFESEE